jgi:hypothetical protein
MKTLFLVIPLRISVRYTLSCGLLEFLKRAKDLRIIIFTVIDDPKFKEEFADKNIIIEQIPRIDEITETRLEKIIRLLREYFFGVCFDTATFNLYVLRHGRPLYIFHRLMVFLLGWARFIMPFLASVDDNLVSSRRVKNYEKYFDKYKPDFVFIHSCFEKSGIPLARVAKRRGIPVTGVVISWDHFVTPKGAASSIKFDKIIVWNEIMRKEGVELFGYAPQDIIAMGSPQFDYYVNYKNEIPSREKFFKDHGLDLTKKLIFFTTSPPRISPKSPEIVELLYKLLEEGKFKKPTQIFVMIYGRDDPARYNHLLNKKDLIFQFAHDLPKNLTYLEADRHILLKNLGAAIRHADVLVNVVSTTTIDAAMLDTPVVNVFIPKFVPVRWEISSHFAKLLALGGTRVAYNEKQLVEAINAYLNDHSFEREQRRRVVKEFIYKTDGQATKALADYILKQLEKV